NRIPFSIIGYFFSVNKDNCPWSVEGYFGSVPLWTRKAGFGKGLCQGIYCSRVMVFILIRKFGFVVDLNLVTVMYRHPLLPGFKRNTYKDAGVAVLVPH